MIITIIQVTESVSSEPGWLSGEVRGHVGWFPEAYVEKMDQTTGWSDANSNANSNGDPVGGAARHHLEGIQELPENVSDNGSITEAALSALPADSHSAFTPVASHLSDSSASPVLGQVPTYIIF